MFALLDRGVRLSFIVDGAGVAMAWSTVARQASRTLDVLVKVDVGFHRCGVEPARPDVSAFVADVASAPGLRLQGLLSHAGHAYAAPDDEALSAIVRGEARLLHDLADAVRRHGASIEELSVGSTPTARLAGLTHGLTEMRPGNYVFYDRTQVALGSAAIAECALTVLATVVSRHGDRVILDAGSKTLSSDLVPRAGHPGYGAVLAEVSQVTTLDQGLVIERLSEEHATVRALGTCRLQPGDRVRILPNHACATTNLADEFALVDGDQVTGRLPIAARGRTQ